MFENNFNEEDAKNVVEFLNLVAKHAKFEMDTNDLIKYFKALTFMQKTLLPKINDHILEIKKIHEAKDKPEPKSRKKG